MGAINCFGYDEFQWNFYHTDDGDTMVQKVGCSDPTYCFDDEILELPEVKERFAEVMDKLYTQYCDSITGEK